MPPELDDEHFLRAFLDLSLDPSAFDHRGHLRLAWIVLQRCPLEDAIVRIGQGIRAYATHLGAASKYDRGVTEALVRIMHARGASDRSLEFPSFLAKNPDLCADARGVLRRYFGDARVHVADLYEKNARVWDAERDRSLFERAWLDRFTKYLEPGATVLDLGCGAGEPIARHFLEAGFSVVGVDAAPSMIALCRERFPAAEWHVADMRALDLRRRFSGLLVWDSFFHLSTEDQPAMIPRFAAHASRGAPLLFTTGPARGETIGAYRGAPLYHASLAPAEYEALLAANGFSVLDFRSEDPACGAHTVWLAVFERG